MCLSVDEWIKEYVIYTFTMEYCSAMRKKEVLSFATIWMNLESIYAE